MSKHLPVLKSAAVIFLISFLSLSVSSQTTQTIQRIDKITHIAQPTPAPPPESIVLCVVDNRRLTQADVDRLLAKITKQETADEELLERRRLVYTQNIVTEWLERNILSAEAEREGIAVSAEEINQQEAALKQAARVEFDVENALQKIGANKDEYRRQLSDAILGEKLVRKKIGELVTEEELRALYNRNPASYVRPPRVRAVHVFCPLTGKETSAEKKERREFMENVRKGARKGGDFRVLAAQADPSWRVIGGDMGWMPEDNRLPKPINKLLFKLKVGAISDVEETEYGYYIIRVEEKQSMTGRNFEEARQFVMDSLFDVVREKVLEDARKNHRVLINISGIPPEKLQ
ncbi:MAG TPA: peptidyl-prolyl cis-trans isomerase [Candidatus Sumerlaeota bacterium]|nr:peptidyl-prolyl cis-trans isomerase [Candidatus Sumerlaeota bacterium]HON50721.1 peptidyl-prolyl cis-trans isomerase [Candidatus Sumerlaeota bacterium]HOR65161.1 peptidyl-prolyl cis-trans isomerase [Candidatus Sumerlaeota bacterium]HPL75303.1 peptidyl-prolyl cis-trans isomerase [Candidatus Sumerlaeota bacterium]HRU55365.1 peptidyl-prolyl cis-trans isomerase [Candidatus Sumerlaeia bacterium]